MKQAILPLLVSLALATCASFAAAQDGVADKPTATEAEVSATSELIDGPEAGSPAAGDLDADDPTAEESADAEADQTEDEPAGDAPGGAEADPVEESIDWAGLAERAPAFIAVTHHAAVHLPIALWLFGALFVVIGVFAPSLRNQVPAACLIGGALTCVAATASGWWYAEYEYGEPWAWGDGWGDWDEHLVKHRWMGVALAVSSLALSVLAIVSLARGSKRLGVVWRLGLIGLAAAVAWEGHLGGELIQGEGFLEEAFYEWTGIDLTGELAEE